MKLLDQIADKIRMKHYSRKTLTAYVLWCKRFILFHGKRHPREMGKAEIEAYLNHLANVAHVAASTQNQWVGSACSLHRITPSGCHEACLAAYFQTLLCNSFAVGWV